MMVDHENVLPVRQRHLQGRQITMCWFCHQLGGPFFRKCRAVNMLMFLCAGREIGSASYSLIVDYLA